MIDRAPTFVLTLVVSAALVGARAHAAPSPTEADPSSQTEPADTDVAEADPADTDVADTDSAAARRASLVIDTSDVGEEGPVVKRRVRERTDVALRAAGVLPARDEGDARIHVDIDPLQGEDPGYRFELWVVRDGMVVGERRRVECTLCTESEIVERVELTVGAVLTLLEASEPAEAEPGLEPEATSKPEPQPTPTEPNPEKERKSRLSGLGKAGVAVLVLGVVAAGTGAVLVALPPTVNEDDPLYETTTRPPGFAALGGGAAAIIAGAVMLGVDVKRSKARTTALSPALGRGFAGLTWRGRF